MADDSDGYPESLFVSIKQWPALNAWHRNEPPNYIPDGLTLWVYAIIWTLIFVGGAHVVINVVSLVRYRHSHSRFSVLVLIIQFFIGVLYAFIIATACSWITYVWYSSAFVRPSPLVPLFWALAILFTQLLTGVRSSSTFHL